MQRAAYGGQETEAGLVVRIVGESGEGVVTLGDLTVRLLASLGLQVCTFQTFPAEIRGGPVMYQLRTSVAPPLTHGDRADILLALSAEALARFGDSLAPDALVILDEDAHVRGSPGIRAPLRSLAAARRTSVRQEMSAADYRRLPPPVNVVGLGVLLGCIGLPLHAANAVVERVFAKRGGAILKMNLDALRDGHEWAVAAVADRHVRSLTPPPERPPLALVSGNEMLCLGAMAAGVRFFAGYPITPATDIMEFLAKELPRLGGDVVQAEDEIAALGMCLGASFAGRVVMTATSGPGLSLMVEQINLAGQAELPVTIAEVQRGGASTGMPTKTSQGDLNLAIYGVHNESPRIVMAAASVEDCFATMAEAVRLAERYQCPTIVLSDQALATRKATVTPPRLEDVRVAERVRPSAEELGPEYRRYRVTATGISPMTVPGDARGDYVCTGIEHDEYCDPGYTPELAMAMKQKRFRKLDTLLAECGSDHHREWGDTGHVQVGLIAFGSIEGILREAMERARRRGVTVALLHLRLLNPLPANVVRRFAARCQAVLVAELNFTGQFASWLRTQADIECYQYHEDEGVPFSATEIEEQILRVAEQRTGGGRLLAPPGRRPSACVADGNRSAPRTGGKP